MSYSRPSEEQEKTEQQRIGNDNAKTSTTSSSSAVDVLGALMLVIERGWVARVGSLQATSLDCLVACRDIARFRLKVAKKTPSRVWHPKLCGRGRRQGSVSHSVPPMFHIDRYLRFI